MKTVFYEKAADEKNHLYYMNFPVMENLYKFFGTHVHNSIELVVCYRGEMKYVINDIDGKFSSGQILITNSYDSHFYEHINDASIYIFVFSRNLLNEVLLDENVEFNNVLSFNKENFESILTFINKEYPKLNDYNLLEKKGFVLSLFGKISKFTNLLRPRVKTLNKNIASIFMEYIDENYKNPITLDIAAKHFGYNRNYFSTLFEKIIGMTFINYLNSFRMDKVNQLKKEKKALNMTTEELIKSCGFSTSEKYYRVCRKNKKMN